MAMLDYSEIVGRKFIVLDGEPWEVIDSHVFRKQQRKPVNATKLKNLITGKVTERSFHVSEKVEEAEIEERDVKFLYQNRGEFWFCESDDPSKRFKIDENFIGIQAKFIKKDSIVQALSFNDPSSRAQHATGQAKIIGMKIPIKIDLKVIEAHPAVKGNTASGASKTVKLETGAEINVPMFIKEGEIIRVNSETGEYAERVGGNSF